jgi:hypothetical protein
VSRARERYSDLARAAPDTTRPGRPTRRRRSWFGTRIFAAGAADDLAPGIYGLVISASVLAASDPDRSIWHVMVTLVVTVFVYWLAERYSLLLAVQVHGEGVTLRQVADVLRRGWRMVEASYTPVLVLVGAWLLGASTAEAIAAAVYYTTGLLIALGWLIGRRTGQTGWALAGTMAFVGALGFIIVVLKLALH